MQVIKDGDFLQFLSTAQEPSCVVRIPVPSYAGGVPIGKIMMLRAAFVGTCINPAAAETFTGTSRLETTESESRTLKCTDVSGGLLEGTYQFPVKNLIDSRHMTKSMLKPTQLSAGPVPGLAGVSYSDQVNNMCSAIKKITELVAEIVTSSTWLHLPQPRIHWDNEDEAEGAIRARMGVCPPSHCEPLVDVIMQSEWKLAVFLRRIIAPRATAEVKAILRSVVKTGSFESSLYSQRVHLLLRTVDVSQLSGILRNAEGLELNVPRTSENLKKVIATAFKAVSKARR